MKFKLQRKEDVWQAIRRRGKELASKLKDKEIFLSAEFSTYATRLADFILRNHKLYQLDIQYDTDKEAPIAFTDGKRIVLNVGNCLAAKPKLLERRFKTNMGILFHECGHKMFIDFNVHNKITSTLQAGKLFGAFSDQLTKEQVTAVKEMEDVIASAYCDALTGVFCNVNNCIVDGHDEAAMKRCFPGFIADCITVSGEVQMECMSDLDKAISNRASDYAIFDALILQYAKFGRYKVKGTEAEEHYLEKMRTVEPIIDAALLEDDCEKRWDYINQLMLFLWPTIRDQFPKNPQKQAQGQSQGQPGQNGSNGSGNGSSAGSSASSGGNHSSGATAPSPQAVETALQNLAQQVQQAMKAAPAPVNGEGAAVDPGSVAAGSASAPGAAANGLEQIMQTIAEDKAATQVQKELDQAQMEAIRNMNLPLVHKSVPFKVNRHNTENELKYKEISAEIAPVVRNLSKQMLELFREFNEERIQHHKRYGPIVEVAEAYRPDRAFFAKKKLPEDVPDMALCVLIDQSGSMYGQKLEAAIKTAILLEQFADQVGIPLLVAGHNVRNKVELHIFTDFVSATTQKDKYSLAGISAGGCNRDGLPIRLCCDLLEQRPEKVRLMVIISDGSPADTDYCGEEARKDISDTVNQFRRRGLTIYGAAIDEDKEIIQSIYGNGFLSISNLDLLPKTLVRLVRQHII